MEKFNLEELVSFHRWNKDLFSIKCTRNKNFKFNNGEFVMLGLHINKIFISRAYSVASANYEEYLEFLSIDILNGIFTNSLKNLNFNDKIYVSKKSTGTIKLNNLLDNGKNLWMMATGTGLSPFISIIKDYEIYEKYENIILLHSVTKKTSIVYKYYIMNLFNKNNILKNFKFLYYPIITKDNFKNNTRITESINNNSIFYNIGLKPFNKQSDRVMICGNTSMIKDLSLILKKKYDFLEYNNNNLGHYVIEKAFLN